MLSNLAAHEFVLVAPRLSLTFMRSLNRSIVGVLSAKDKVPVNSGKKEPPKIDELPLAHDITKRLFQTTVLGSI